MKILLIGMGGLYNRGCEAIARGSAKILRQMFPGAEVALAIGDPDIARQDRKRLPDLDVEIYPLLKHKSKAPSLPLRLVRRAIRELAGDVALYRLWRPWRPLGYPDKGWDLVLEIGGDTFAYTNSLVFRSLHDQWLMDTKGFRVGLWGLNLVPYDLEVISKERLKRVFLRYQLITVRDRWSQRYLAELGVEKNVFQMADPAFEMDPAPWDVDSYFPAKSERGVIGLNLSPLAASYRVGGIHETIQLAIDTARGLDDMGFGVLLVPHCFPPACPAFDDDNNVLRPAFEQLGSEGLNVGLLPSGISSPQVKYAISQCTLFAGARMHSTIAAWSTGVPVLTISYSPKSLNVNDDIHGHRRYVVDIRSVTGESLVDILGAMASDLDTLRQATQFGVQRLREHTHTMVSRIAANGAIEDM